MKLGAQVTDETNATVTVAVAVASEAATEAAEQENDEDDDKNESQRHGHISFGRTSLNIGPFVTQTSVVPLGARGARCKINPTSASLHKSTDNRPRPAFSSRGPGPDVG